MVVSPTTSSLVLALLVTESLPCQDELPQFSADHLFSDVYLLVVFAVVHSESQTNEIGQD